MRISKSEGCGLPNGTGKTVRFGFAKGDKVKEALTQAQIMQAAKNWSKKIQKKTGLNLTAVATNDMMGVVGKIGRVLG